MSHRHFPVLVFGAGLPGGRGSGSYVAQLLCPVCRAPFPVDRLEAALGDLRRRGMGPRLLARVREHATEDFGRTGAAAAR